MRVMYFEEEDVLHLSFSDEPKTGSVEFSPNITAELNDKGELIGVEILDASEPVWDSVCPSAPSRRPDR